MSIRSEEDKDILKKFTQEQHKIRNREVEKMTDKEKKEKIKELQEMFAKAFS